MIETVTIDGIEVALLPRGYWEAVVEMLRDAPIVESADVHLPDFMSDEGAALWRAEE